MNRRTWGPATALAAALAACVEVPGGAKADNVLLVVLDDVGVDSIGAYAEGGDIPPTPTIDALCARGVMFRNAWAPPLCTPGRAAILTGRYGFRTGVGEIAQRALPDDELTLAEMLDVGTGGAYASAAIGKWHAGGNAAAPQEQGFDHHAGGLGNLPDYYAYRKSVDGVLSDVEEYATTAEVDDALRWIESVPEPWFCYLAFHAAHMPFHDPPPELHDANGRPRAGDVRRFQYKAAIQALDTELGRLFGALGPERLARTHVVVVGDDGTPQQVNAPPFPRAHGKGTLYEGALNVPLVVAGPAVAAPGREVAALVDVTDLMLTVAELARADVAVVRAAAKGPLDSVSLVPYLENPDQPPLRATVYADKFEPNGLGPWDPWVQAIRDERFKLIRRTIGERWVEELFDLERDPFERRDLLARELPPGIAKRHEELAAALAERTGVEPPATLDGTMRR